MRDILASIQATQARKQALFQAIGSALLLVFDTVTAVVAGYDSSWFRINAASNSSRASRDWEYIDMRCEWDILESSVSGTVVMVEKVVVVVVLVC